MTERKIELQQRITRELEVCDRHLLRIHEALAGLSAVLPITLDDFNQLGEEHVRCFDQFIFRFSKFQDAIGAKLFRLLLELLDEDVVTLPMRDMLNMLERYQIIHSAEQWQMLRELRNTITHEYSLDDNDKVIALNQLVERLPEIIMIYEKIKQEVG